MTSRTRCSFVPPYLLRQLASASPDATSLWDRTLVIDEQFRLSRPAVLAGTRTSLLAGAPAWVVHSADNGSELPGTPVRSAGQDDSGDLAVDEAAYGVSASLALFDEVYGRASYDGEGAPVSVTVHYGRDYANAFWDGTQLVFGDGDRLVFERFTKPVDVLGHEFTHAVTEHTAGLVYEGQSGALNESMSDVFAACLKQRLLGQSPLDADWLIGEGLFVAGIGARGLRDMAAPGTAYDDPALGRDPQPAHMDDFLETTDDNGGVHLNSGIPNRAFHLAATAIDGTSAEGAGRIWYAALTGGSVGARTDFAGFAAATVEAAGPDADAVREAWVGVGVLAGAAGSLPVPAERPAGQAPGQTGAESGVVSVRRTGGFLGRATEGRLDLTGDDPRTPEVRDLVERVDLRGVRAGDPRPDMYVYDFDLCGSCARVPEQHLTDDLRRVADLLLDVDLQR